MHPVVGTVLFTVAATSEFIYDYALGKRTLSQHLQREYHGSGATHSEFCLKPRAGAGVGCPRASIEEAVGISGHADTQTRRGGEASRRSRYYMGSIY